MHAVKIEPPGQLAGGVDQLGPGFDAVDAAARTRLEIQVVEDETEVGLAGAVVSERDVVGVAQ